MQFITNVSKLIPGKRIAWASFYYYYYYYYYYNKIHSSFHGTTNGLTPACHSGSPLSIKYMYYLQFCYLTKPLIIFNAFQIRGLLEKYPTFGREKETGLLGALDT